MSDLFSAAREGDTNTIKRLLTATGIKVNAGDVSLYLLTPSPLVIGGRCEGDLPLIIPHYFPRNDDLSSPKAKYAPTL